jgi:hypothetical protein
VDSTWISLAIAKDKSAPVSSPCPEDKDKYGTSFPDFVRDKRGNDRWDSLMCFYLLSFRPFNSNQRHIIVIIRGACGVNLICARCPLNCAPANGPLLYGKKDEVYPFGARMLLKRRLAYTRICEHRAGVARQFPRAGVERSGQERCLFRRSRSPG